MNTHLLQRQELKIVMTEQLLKSIELLQYTSVELMEFITLQQQEHPLIEIIESIPKIRLVKGTDYSYSGVDHFIEKTVQEVRDFRTELYELASLTFQPKQLQVLYFIIFNLDNQGYLQIDEIDLVVAGFSEREIDEGIALLQQIGPRGIGARNLAECLLLQLDKQQEHYQITSQLIRDDLPLIAEKNWKQLSMKYKLPILKIKEIAQYIKTLQPKPCVSLTQENIQMLIPDIFIEVTEDNVHYRLSNFYSIEVHFNGKYIDLAQQKGQHVKFIQNQYKIYQWLKNSIESRKMTMTKIMDIIVREQQDFFKYGFTKLKPLHLAEIAKEIDMHESTVSRAIKNKVIQTSFGTVLLRQLFTSKLLAADGQIISQQIIKQYLKQLIIQENKVQPLADQTIAECIEKKFNIAISRRTINKYRQQMNIPSKKDRKLNYL